MQNHNLPPSSRLGLVDVINPSSQAAGTATTGWISMASVGAVLAAIQVGALGASATVDAKFQQATSAAGAGAKDITGKAITQLTKAGTDDNKQVLMSVRAEDLDFNNGFTHVRLSMTVATAACLTSAMVFGMDGRYGEVAHATTVDEVVV